ncbi:MAG TPA: FAD-dependent oxidoreductase [Anaerolineales bacterium]|nr:FAD-dependent oxidoreductase [Anaerolineales bacterium]
MSKTIADAVICGAGIAGVSVAYQLAVKHQMKKIMLVDPLPPLTMTSDKSTECYRNWWPGPGDAMVRLMNRSIDILEQLHQEAPGRLPMNRRGYVYATADPSSVERMIAEAKENTELGAGTLRIHRGSPDDPVYIPFSEHGIFDAPDGADILLDIDLIRQHFPHLTEKTLAVLHTRRCGWFSAQQFGMYMLEKAKESGVQLINGRVEDISVENNKVTAIKIEGKDEAQTISTRIFVNTAGPMQRNVGRMMNVDIPVFSELHIKMAFNDSQHAIPRDMPLTIWNDPVRLTWSEEEKEFWAESEDTRWLLEEMPAGVHGRAEGKGSCLLQWDYRTKITEPVFPIPVDELFPEIVLRGMVNVIPGLEVYLSKLPQPSIDGGYYTRTEENRPLIGPLPVDGAYMLGGVGGFGMQVSCGASDLLAAHITNSELPDYAPAFLFSRYEDPDYKKLLDNWGSSGQI